MHDHFIVAADHGHLRIFRPRQEPGQREPHLDQVQAIDFPAARQNYTDRDTAPAGRFQGSQNQSGAPGAPAARTGMSIDERLPMQREEERRRVRDVAQEIETFFVAHRGATWDFAGAPSLHNAVLEQLSAPLRAQLRHSVAKDLVNRGPDQLRAALMTAGR